MSPFVLFCIFILGHSLKVSYNTQCSCSKFGSDTSCLEQTNCIWRTEGCQSRECTEYYDKEKCNRVASCSWNVSKCEKFTKCANYYMNDSYDCYKIGDQNLNLFCEPSDEPNMCQDYEVQLCGDVEEDCTGFQSQWSLCYWNNNSCNVVDIRYCDKLFDEDLCIIFGEGLGCQWKDNKCTVISCSDYTSESTCVLQRQNFIEDDPLLCKWSEIKCEEAPDISHLDFSNCLVNSFYNYIWDSINKQCVSCLIYVPPSTDPVQP
ncbi:unnamed protein product (macronuclear) [Paramecium tetraurelia]|uniref:Mini antigen n=1 Tax=Paramecium tetraurelia TaxID=5888 RepID=A0E4Z5_PARTE|nr:uncharacterized protein GSPATT00023539001 [Paramecium tetraurelia]CAK90362.1 unnamed protein product [Paramecium tetraurelia]|eukprot:XP_001457759.1 hypothetical protein (macronuclear) [Paramecium tetraurelia strain d4-2]